MLTSQHKSRYIASFKFPFHIHTRLKVQEAIIDGLCRHDFKSFMLLPLELLQALQLVPCKTTRSYCSLCFSSNMMSSRLIFIVHQLYLPVHQQLNKWQKHGTMSCGSKECSRTWRGSMRHSPAQLVQRKQLMKALHHVLHRSLSVQNTDTHIHVRALLFLGKIWSYSTVKSVQTGHSLHTWWYSPLNQAEFFGLFRQQL